MSLAVDNPILNNPFEEPREYWIYEEGQPKKMAGRWIYGKYFAFVVKIIQHSIADFFGLS